MFDDFLNAAGASELAILNINYLKSKGIKNTGLDNFTDVYLAHQQGRGGILRVINNPLIPVETNQANNPPPGTDKFRVRVITKNATMREWYVAWNGYIDGIAKVLDPSYVSKIKIT